MERISLEKLRQDFEAWKTKPENTQSVEVQQQMEHLLTCAESALEKASLDDCVWRATAAEFFNEARSVAILSGIQHT